MTLFIILNGIMTEAVIRFFKADSTNIPKVDLIMILEYFKTSDRHNIAEIRGVKALRSSNTAYLETAVGYVEVQRMTPTCIVRAKIVPEHKVSKKYYVVQVTINEENENIIDATCDGCAASEGGCKHTLVLLFWLQKKNDIPAPTSVQCYWNKPRLGSEYSEAVTSKEIANKATTSERREGNDPNVLKKFYAECIKQNIGSSSIIMKFGPHQNVTLNAFCLFDLVLNFVETTKNYDYENFKEFAADLLNNEVINDIQLNTIKQSDSKLWHSMRQGRITGSKIYEVSQCKTSDGVLVEQILGGYKVPETKAILRGKILENKVLKKIETNLNIKIEKCGMFLYNAISGASPDGLGNDFVVEIKCPISNKTLKNYIENGNIKKKPFAQLQFQMFAAKKSKGLFCVADPQFETNDKLHITWVQYNEKYALNLYKKAEDFWKDNIYPKILDSAKN